MISLKDNNPYGDLTGQEYDLVDLQAVSNVPLQTLVNDNPQLLVFPHLLESTNDIDPNSVILSLVGSTIVQTGNIVGYLKTGDTEISISSRFAGDNNDFFLRYLIEKTLNINLMDFNLSSSKNPVFDFLRFIFPQFLRKTLAQGMYKEYVTIRHNDLKFKGMLDIPRHIKANVPFQGRISYNTRERSDDNIITELIRHTIEFIDETSPAFGRVMENDSEIREYISMIRSITAGYSKRNRLNILHKSESMKISPYYSFYRPLVRLCQAILKLKKLAYGNEDRKLYGILFDISWMWEAYVWTLLKPLGFNHPDNRRQSNPLYLLKEGRWVCFPDFYRNDCVIDAKYKNIDNEIEIADRYQLITYAHRLKVNTAGFAMPYQGSYATRYYVGELEGNTINGHPVSIYKFQIPISLESSDYNVFRCQMDDFDLSSAWNIWYSFSDL